MASTGPFSNLAVVEIDRKLTEVGATQVATRDLTAGIIRAADIVSVYLMGRVERIEFVDSGWSWRKL